MKEEIAKVLTMVKDGKIDAEKASELIDVLKEKEAGSNQTYKSSNYAEKILKIRVLSAENDNVKINVPIKLVKALLVAGNSILASIPESEKYVKDIDINLIVEAIENELDGQLVDIQTGNGDIVSVIIE
ncbi:SHOCT-like domain-containing protein [Gottfriedia solisilvae]|uniref:YvlB/LiaX N-terminal domain-containing protein n=1 Tax=Gottfriedia solisilvae TaxID=1516104 RepID=A0A8J3APF0_9BACI|nr:hypothetical protein [Gottfriedia solisilvae]GGI16455.1 hypothetical protein GCM10007380_33050 [Gottfriedia solisilvae]